MLDRMPTFNPATILTAWLCRTARGSVNTSPIPVGAIGRTYPRRSSIAMSYPQRVEDLHRVEDLYQVTGETASVRTQQHADNSLFGAFQIPIFGPSVDPPGGPVMFSGLSDISIHEDSQSVLKRG